MALTLTAPLFPGARDYVFLTSEGEVRHEMLDFLLGPS